MGLIPGELCQRGKKKKDTNRFFRQKMHCQAFYILQLTAVDYSVIIFTILITWLYSYNVTSHRKLNPNL